MKAATFATFFLFVACLFSSSFAVVQPVQAATACEGEVAAPEWNTTAQRLALVPHGVYGTPFMFEEMYDDDMDDDGGKRAPVASTGELDPLLHPEETWMYNPVWPLPTLEPLTTGQYANMQVGNDSAGVLRFNLSSAHRTTFCISLFTLVDNQTVPADGDVYLMTASQYDSYQEVYRMMHGGWWWDDLDLAGGDSNLLSDVPPNGEVSIHLVGRHTGMHISMNHDKKQPSPWRWTALRCTLRCSAAPNGRISTSLLMPGTTPTTVMLEQPTVFSSPT